MSLNYAVKSSLRSRYTNLHHITFVNHAFTQPLTLRFLSDILNQKIMYFTQIYPLLLKNTLNTIFPHDRIFKNLMSDPYMAEVFLKHYLPQAVHELIDYKTLVLCPETYINIELELISSDILFKVNIGDTQGFLYMLFEHQSTVDPLMPFRLLQYITEIWSKHLKKTQKKILPLVIPIVFYHGKSTYNGPRDIKELIEGPIDLIEAFLLKPFHLIDTHTLDDEVLEKQNLAGFMTFIMKNIYVRDFMQNKKILYNMLTNLINKHGETASVSVVNLLNYLVRYGNTDQPEVFINEVSEILSNKVEIKEEFMGTVADYLHNKGLELGRTTTSQNILQRLIQVKFNCDLSAYREQINQAHLELLEKWTENVLYAESIEQVFETH